MLIRHLDLQHYRNYARLEATFESGLVVLQGANAQGKTNLLEAIYLLATTKSSRARNDTELISWRERDPLSQIDFARIVGRIERGGTTQTLEVVIRESGEGQARKRFRLNGAERRAGEVLGKVNAVFFSPADVDLVDGSPSVRRRYLDVMLCQVEPAYFRALSQYNRAILQRNALLRQVRERQQQATSLEYWDGLMCEQGALVIAWRATAIRDLAAAAADQHRDLSSELETLEVRYRPALIDPPPEDELAAGGPLLARDALRRSMGRQRDREIAAGVSLVGPHRDDLTFTVSGIDATAFGSRGQQRTATLALKLAEVTYMRAATGEEPILLLDDATSELDPRRRAAILTTAAAREQTFMTSADGSSLGDLAAASQRWDVRQGTLHRLP